MIDSQLIKNIISELEPEIGRLKRSIDESPSLPQKYSLTHLTNICLRLRDAYCSPDSLTASELLKLKKDVYLSKREMKQNPTEYTRKKYIFLSEKLREQQSVDALDQILMISEDMPDILNLLTFTNVFNIMGHLEKAPPNVRSICYDIKDNLLAHLVTLTKNKKDIGSIVIPSTAQNAKNVFYLWIEGIEDTKMFSWHSKILPATDPKELYDSLPQTILQKGITDITETDLSLYFGDILNNTQTLSQMWTYCSKEEHINKINGLLTSEFIGGGTYENSIKENNAHNVTERSESELINAIKNSNNDKIKNLMSLTAPVQPRYSLDVNKMIVAEIMQTAFSEGIITENELEKMHLKIFDSLLRTADRHAPAELKSCGKNGEKKLIVLHVQKKPSSKPLIWDISTDTFETLAKKYSGKGKEKITLSAGRDVTQRDNFNILTTVVEEQLNHTAKMLNEFLSKPQSKVRLKEAARTADPTTKALIASIIYEFSPKTPQAKQTKSKRNGGPTYE